MQLSKQANERLWDALIKEALIQDCYNELAELEKTVRPHTFSERFEKNIAKMKRKVFGKERLKSAGVIIRNTAAVVIIVIGLTFGVLLNQPEVYAAVENVIEHQLTEFFFAKLDFATILVTLFNIVLYGCIIFLVYNSIKKHKTKRDNSIKDKDFDDKQE